MVWFFEGDEGYVVYMGKDKYENEKLIKCVRVDQTAKPPTLSRPARTGTACPRTCGFTSTACRRRTCT